MLYQGKQCNILMERLTTKKMIIELEQLLCINEIVIIYNTNAWFDKSRYTIIPIMDHMRVRRLQLTELYKGIK